MRLSRTVFTAGVAVIALIAVSAGAGAQPADSHVMLVQLPDGSVGQIRYTGDVPPRVAFAPAPVAVESPFAMMDRMAAAMDRQMEAMMRAANAMDARAAAMMRAAGAPGAAPSGTVEAAFGGLPLGLGLAASGPGAHVCMQSVQITYNGGEQPKVVSQTSGDCDGPHEAATPAQMPVAPPPAHRPNTIEVKATGSSPYQPPVEPVAGRWRS